MLLVCFSIQKQKVRKLASRQIGFTLIEISLVLFILISLLIISYASSNKSSDLRLAKVAVFEARKIAQLAEECRNNIQSTTVNLATGIYDDAYLITSVVTTQFKGTVDLMLTKCGNLKINIPNKTPFDYGDDYYIEIDDVGSNVTFFVPIENFTYPNTDVVTGTLSGGTYLNVKGQKRFDNSFRFGSRALMDKGSFFKEKIDRDG